MKKRYYARRRRGRRKAKARFYVIAGLLIVALALGIFLIVQSIDGEPGDPQPPSASVEMTPPDGSATLPGAEDAQTAAQPVPTLAAELEPHATENTRPEKFGIQTEIMVGDQIVASYTAGESITFGAGDQYTALEGILTYRGNNYRDAPGFGVAAVTEGALELVVTKKTGSLGKWGGNTATGQPLVVKWPAETRKNMTSLYEPFRDKDGFTEVVCASLNGDIYFMELETGEKTRDPIKTGAPVKGTASIDPRGYPIIYVGQGLQANGSENGTKDMYMRAFSLIDGSLLMKFGWETADPFAHRSWQAFDSSPLIDAESDTLIVPGENGVLYVCKLNASYDAEEGSVSMDMDPAKVKYRYTSPRNKEASANGRWGTPSSAVAWRDNLIFTDNAGMLSCVNLNTMRLKYANDLGDDSDATMVLEEDTGGNTFYLYTGCDYDKLVRPLGANGPAYARKLSGVTGEIIWEKEFTVHSGSKADGGVVAAPVLGRTGTDMDGLIVYNVTQEVKDGSTTSRLVALNKNTGEQVWEYDMETPGWSPSAPVSVYTPDGKGYIVQCDNAGDVALIDGATGAEVDRYSVEDPIEATPAVYGNMIVVGSSKSRIFYIRIK